MREFALGHGFFALIPTGRPYSYATKGNWEGVGIRPDQATDGDALDSALKLAGH